MSDKYILDANGEPMVCVDLMKWGRWLEKAERHVGNDNIGDVHVSTVFLGLDHSFGEPGPPVLWETMIFGGPHSDYTERYTSRANAIAGHARAVALASSNGVEAQAPRERALEEALRRIQSIAMGARGDDYEHEYEAAADIEAIARAALAPPVA